MVRSKQSGSRAPDAMSTFSKAPKWTGGGTVVNVYFGVEPAIAAAVPCRHIMTLIILGQISGPHLAEEGLQNDALVNQYMGIKFYLKYVTPTVGIGSL